MQKAFTLFSVFFIFYFSFLFNSTLKFYFVTPCTSWQIDAHKQGQKVRPSSLIHMHLCEGIVLLCNPTLHAHVNMHSTLLGESLMVGNTQGGLFQGMVSFLIVTFMLYLPFNIYIHMLFGCDFLSLLICWLQVLADKNIRTELPSFTE